MDLISEIKKLYFEKHLKQKDISDIVGVSPAYVSQVLSKTDKTEEKMKRHQNSVNKKKAYNNSYWKSYIRPKKDTSDKDSYEVLQAQLDKDSKILSTPSNISNEQLVYSNLGAYSVDKNGNLKINKSLNPTSDMLKIFNRNIKVPPQKQKHIINMVR